MSNNTFFSIHDYFEVVSPSGHTLFVPLKIGIDTLPEELEMCLRTIAQGDFVSYRNITALELMISMLLEKLQIYYQSYPNEALVAAKRMIRILEATDTDDDVFPYGQIAAIESIVHIA